MERVLCVIVLATTLQGIAPKYLPSYILSCSATDGECLSNVLVQLRPHLAEGIPEFDLPPIDPLDLPDHRMSSHASPDEYFRANLSKVRYTGASNFEVSRISFDPDVLKFDLVIEFPQVALTASESAQGLLFGVKINDTGDIKLTFENVTMSIALSGENKFVDGKTYLLWKEESIVVSLDVVTYELEKLFKGRPEDWDLFAMKLWENRAETNLLMGVLIKDTLGAFVLEAFNHVHSGYPVGVLYPIA